MVRNVEFQIISYFVFYINLGFGGSFDATYNTYLFKISPTRDDTDYFKIITQLIFLFIFIYYLYILLIKMFEQNRAYDRWEKEQINLMNDLIIKFRNRMKPEFLRKLEYILDLSKLNDLVFVTLSIYFIYLNFKLLMMQIQLNSADFDNINLFLLRNMVYLQGVTRENVEITGSVMLILSSFKFITNLNNGKYLAILASTIIDSKTNNLIFIVIFCLIQPAFFCFGNIMFGYNLIDFKTITNSMVSCFTIFFSNLFI